MRSDSTLEVTPEFEYKVESLSVNKQNFQEALNDREMACVILARAVNRTFYPLEPLEEPENIRDTIWGIFDPSEAPMSDLVSLWLC